MTFFIYLTRPDVEALKHDCIYRLSHCYCHNLWPHHREPHFAQRSPDFLLLTAPSYGNNWSVSWFYFNFALLGVFSRGKGNRKGIECQLNCQLPLFEAPPVSIWLILGFGIWDFWFEFGFPYFYIRGEILLFLTSGTSIFFLLFALTSYSHSLSYTTLIFSFELLLQWRSTGKPRTPQTMPPTTG